MRAGNLRHRVQTERLSTAPDGGGGYVESWVPIAQVWAQVEALSGREYWQAMQVQSEARYRLRLRYQADLTAADRIVCGGAVLNIEHVADPDGRRRELEVLCRS
jgi:SPP1 family predicted phage head-tail adaptor